MEKFTFLSSLSHDEVTGLLLIPVIVVIFIVWYCNKQVND